MNRDEITRLLMECGVGFDSAYKFTKGQRLLSMKALMLVYKEKGIKGVKKIFEYVEEMEESIK